MTEPTLKPSPISIPEGETIGEHKFPWKPSEFLAIAIVAAAGIGVMVASDFAPGSLLMGGALLAVVPYFIWLAQSRKSKSLISIVHSGDKWLLVRGRIHDSSDSNVAIVIEKLARIDMADYSRMPNAVVLIEGDNPLMGHKALAFPARLLKDLSFRGRMSALANTPGIEVSKRAAEAIGIS